MSNIIKLDFEGSQIGFNEQGWFNATEAARKYGKFPNEWLRLPATKSYLAAFARKYGKIPYLKTARGGMASNAGTWLHPKLSVAFARWLSDDFALWCDEQIEQILNSGHAQSMSVWQELQRLELEDADSKARASFGSRLMLDRKRKLPGIQSRRSEIEARFAPPLFRLAGVDAAA